jgi:hypothetical protein
VKLRPITLLFGAFVTSIGLLVFPEPSTAGAATAHSSPSASPSASPKGKGKGVCGATKSKWAHMQCEQYNSSAPGDEYFGRMKMSYLGIDNTYKDGSISAGAYSTDPKLISKLDFATEALKRWAAKYPNDPQLPRSYFLGIQVLRKMYTQAEQQTAWEFMHVLVTKYKGTYFGKVTTASLASGFTEHWFALAEICPTPLPRGAMPEASPAATPTPSPAPGQPVVELITPPCVQPSPDVVEDAPSSPSPSPTK